MIVGVCKGVDGVVAMDARLSAGRAGRYARPAAHERHAGTIPARAGHHQLTPLPGDTFVTVFRLMAPSEAAAG